MAVQAGIGVSRLILLVGAGILYIHTSVCILFTLHTHTHFSRYLQLDSCMYRCIWIYVWFALQLDTCVFWCIWICVWFVWSGYSGTVLFQNRKLSEIIGDIQVLCLGSRIRRIWLNLFFFFVFLVVYCCYFLDFLCNWVIVCICMYFVFKTIRIAKLWL